MRYLAAFLMLACCGAPRVSPPTGAPPRLVVLLVLDQLPEWAFEAKRPALTQGFDRLLREGTWLVGSHPTPATLTAPGHALLGTGEPPSRSGIIANEWWDRDANKQVKSIDDGDGKSAMRLRVPALGDAMVAANATRAQPGKAFGISLKDRAAILPVGKGGTAIWYDAKSIAFTATRPLAWLDTHAQAQPIQAHLADVWTPLDPAKLAELTGTVDAQPGEVGEKGFGPTFPHAIGATKEPAEAIFATPFGNQLVLDLAVAAIDGEQLGADATPDLLTLSLSAHDYVGHGWGHESWESWDMTLRLDAQLDAFMASLDAKVGEGRWAMVVTSDHGAAPLPERTGGGRVTFEDVHEAANRAAREELGDGTWISFAKFPYVYLSTAARALPEDRRMRALAKVVTAVRAVAGVERVERTADLAGDCDPRPADARALCEMIDVERAGEVLYMLRAGWVHQDADEHVATAHGSFHAYDREVPVILLPPGRTSHAAAIKPTSTIEMTEVAPLLASWLGIPAPSTLR
ncbi:MAG: alkaline phosphatase family protein [Kofleriaceae bacterium]|nr:alkaline phosphatase family protein [Kofleriaceae bacterium]